MADITLQCKICGASGSQNYCPSCGHNLKVKRLTIKDTLNEAFHFFTHFDKGFLYTLKKITVAPGTMQKEYVEGIRTKHQKPFSMFFLCATIAALGIYWISFLTTKYYHAGDVHEANFFHKYWVLLQVCLLPLYALIPYLFFKGQKFNYAEIGVLQLYVFSFLFLMLTIIHLFKLIFPNLETRYIEVPAMFAYSLITYLNFFENERKWAIVLKTILIMGTGFFLSSFIQDFLVKNFF